MKAHRRSEARTRSPSIRLSRTPQPLAEHRLRGGLRKSCLAAPAQNKLSVGQCLAATSCTVMGNACVTAMYPDKRHRLWRTRMARPNLIAAYSTQTAKRLTEADWQRKNSATCCALVKASDEHPCETSGSGDRSPAKAVTTFDRTLIVATGIAKRIVVLSTRRVSGKAPAATPGPYGVYVTLPRLWPPLPVAP
jgi:hypothetical protein